MENFKIAKLISMNGICSRRDAEKLVIEKRVKINDLIITNVAERFLQNVEIKIDDKIITPTKTLLYVFYKPIECITSKIDPQNRKTIYDFIPKNLPHLVPIGRLDFYSEGVLLMTNSGALATVLMNPNNKIPRVYQVNVVGKIERNFIKLLSNGIEIGELKYKPIQCKITSNPNNLHHVLTLTLYEGKNREIRNICKHFNLKIDKLLRVEYAGIQLNSMSPSDIKQIDDGIITQLMDKFSFKKG